MIVNKRIITYAGIGVAALVTVLLIVWLYKRFFRKSAVDDLPVNVDNVTFSDAELKIMAGQLYTAMHGAGTDEKAIYRVLEKLKTKDDWNALVKAFGIKEGGTWVSPFRGNLLDWLQDELSAKEMKRVNEILNLIGVSI